MAELSRPPPPIVGTVTHFSVELYWEEALRKANQEVNLAEGPVRVIVQEQDKDQRTWGSVYTGVGKRCEVKGLEEKTEYRFRLRFQHNNRTSEWSPMTAVSTTREKLNGQNLHKTIMQESEADLEAVLESGEVTVDVPDSLGFTGLMQAAKRGFLPGMELLIRYGADVDYQNASGKTALMMVCAAGKLEPVQVLHKYNARYDLFDNGGCAAIHWAVDGNSIKLVEWLAEHGADLNLRDKGHGNWTPLIRCANLHGNRDLALALMMSGADINAVDSSGSTALHHAVMRKHYDLSQLLLQRRADPLQENKEHNTPCQIAQSSDDAQRRRIAAMMEPFVERAKTQRKMERREMNTAGMTQQSQSSVLARTSAAQQLQAPEKPMIGGVTSAGDPYSLLQQSRKVDQAA